MNLVSSLAAYSGEVHSTLETFFGQQETQARLIDPSIAASLKRLKEFSLRGGKAIRPWLVSLAYALAGGENHPGLIKAAASIELHHKHILILDDIADRDEVRYGGPTLEWAYRKEFAKLPEREHRARSFAMMDGVWLGALARELLFASGFGAHQLVDCVHVLNTLMFRDTLAGWQIHGRQCDKKISEVSPRAFIKGLELVTARYTFEGPFKIGLILAGNRDRDLTQALTLYSQKVGTAFQIHDDILGLFGDTDKTGKPVGNDIREGKKTLLVQAAYQATSPKEKAFIEKAVGNPKLSLTELEQVQNLVRQTGALQTSVKQAQQMVAEGIAALDPLPASPEKQLLVELAHYVIQREK